MGPKENSATKSFPVERNGGGKWWALPGEMEASNVAKTSRRVGSVGFELFWKGTKTTVAVVCLDRA